MSSTSVPQSCAPSLSRKPAAYRLRDFTRLAIFLASTLGPSSAIIRADSITNQPSADTTLFEADPTFNLGATDLTSGSTALPSRSRALIKFDLVAALPSNALIESVAVSLTATRQPSGGTISNFRLFRVLQPWGEGTKTGTHGALATAGEATWNDRFALQPGGTWSTPGAAAPVDFAAAPSASSLLNGLGRFTFASTSNLVADVEFWLRNPTNNYGWILISDAEEVPQTVTHFGSREDPSNAPLLVVQFTASAPPLQPRIDRFTLSSHRVELGFKAQPQFSYHVQFLSSVLGTNWHTLTNLTGVSIQTDVVVSDWTMADPQRFYRLEAIPLP